MRRRVGSTASTAMRRSGRCWAKRESSSSVTVLLPAPPVPVTPTTGTPAPVARQSSRSRSSSASPTIPSSRAESIRATESSSEAAGRLRDARRQPLLRRPLDQVVDHPGQAERHPVVGVVDALDAELLQLGDLLQGDRAAAAAEDADVAGAEFVQHLDRVLEVLGVAALVGADRDRVDVLLDRGPDHVADAAVVAEVDDLGAAVLDQPPHHVDRGVVAVEQRGGGDEAQRQLVRSGGAAALGLVGHGGHRAQDSSRMRDYTDSRNTTYCPGRQARERSRRPRRGPCAAARRARSRSPSSSGSVPKPAPLRVSVARTATSPALRQDLGQDRPPVALVRGAVDQADPLEAVDRVGDAGPVHLQALADLAQRQRPAAAEVQQHQRLVAGEGELERLQQQVQPRDQDLVHPHDRGDGDHLGRRVLGPALRASGGVPPRSGRTGSTVSRPAGGPSSRSTPPAAAGPRRRARSAAPLRAWRSAPPARSAPAPRSRSRPFRRPAPGSIRRP